MPAQVPLAFQVLPPSAVEKVVLAGHLPHKSKVMFKFPKCLQVPQIYPPKQNKPDSSPFDFASCNYFILNVVPVCFFL